MTYITWCVFPAEKGCQIFPDGDMSCESRPQFGLLQLLNQCSLSFWIQFTEMKPLNPWAKCCCLHLDIFTIHLWLLGYKKDVTCPRFFWCVLAAFQHAKAEAKICFSRVHWVPHYALPLSVHCFALIARHLLWHEAMDSCSDLFGEDRCFTCDPEYDLNIYKHI